MSAVTAALQQAAPRAPAAAAAAQLPWARRTGSATQVFTPKSGAAPAAAVLPEAMEVVDVAKQTADSAAVGDKRAAATSPQLTDGAPGSKVSKIDP